MIPMRSLASVAACLTIGVLLPAELSAAEVTFTDQRGKLVTLSGPATRVVAMPKPVPSLFIVVDGGIDHLVGIHPAAQSTIMASVLGRFYPGVADINTNIVGEGFIPNVEELLKINPDVVIQWARNTEEFIEPMERVGLTVVGFGYGTYEIERERVSIIGKMMQKEDRANAFLAWHDQAQQELQEILNTIPHEKKSSHDIRRSTARK
jgi:iron complex transport system substrate-binding protein